jgi:hypothetical protein
MATTAIFIEIIIAGVFALSWVLLLLARLHIFPSTTFLSSLTQYKDWYTAILVGAFAIVYLLGMTINTLSFVITHSLIGKKRGDALFPGQEYATMWALVFHKGSNELMKDILLNFTFIRVYRSAIFNFLFLGITLLLYGRRFLWEGVLCLLASSLFYFLWGKVFILYYELVKAAHKVLSDTTKQDDETILAGPVA